MGKVKTKKHDTFIDMTAMSDVTVLLLTFFMLTATFLPKEPVQVVTPSSVSETKIPESNLMTILINPAGNVYLNLDRPEDKRKVIDKINSDYKLSLTNAQIQSFLNQTHIGVSMQELPKFLEKSLQDQDELLQKGANQKDEKAGIPLDTALTSKNELAIWIQAATVENPDLKIAIKSDNSTTYPAVKNVISTLQDLRQNRFSLITALKQMPADI